MLKGHKEEIVGLYSPEGPKGSLLMSVSKDAHLRVWNVFEKRRITKMFLKREVEVEEDESSQSSSIKSDTKKLQDRDEAYDPLDVVESCLFNRATVFCGFGDGSIYGWNMKSGGLVYKF